MLNNDTACEKWHGRNGKSPYKMREGKADGKAKKRKYKVKY